MKKKIALIFCLILGLITFLFTVCCSSPKLRIFFAHKVSVSIVSYNAQTFFDTMESGAEFKEFRGAKSEWTKEKYEIRLNRLLEAVNLSSTALGQTGGTPDILILQEIESHTVIEDFCKRLPLKDSYLEAVFLPPEEGSAFGCALLSKLPIKNTKIHNVYCEEFKLRPIIETLIPVNINGTEYEVGVFNVHWKSKSGGSNSSHIRKMQEELLFNKIKDFEKNTPQGIFIACGDFNQPLNEFTKLKTFQNCWESEIHNRKTEAKLHAEGSYFFKEEWEGIDHFFYSDNLNDDKGLEISDFAVISEPPLIKTDGTPNRYLLYTGQGYSDHLPIGITLKVK